MLPVAVTHHSYSDDNATCYVFSVLCVTTCFQCRKMNHNRRRHTCFVEFTRWRHRGKVCRWRHRDEVCHLQLHLVTTAVKRVRPASSQKGHRGDPHHRVSFFCLDQNTCGRNILPLCKPTFFKKNLGYVHEKSQRSVQPLTFLVYEN